MLVGQEIGMMEALLITVIGMGVVLLALAILALFIKIISSVVGRMAGKGKKKEEKAAPAAKAPQAAPAVQPAPAAPAAQPAPAVSQGNSFTEEEMACVVAAIATESGASPEQLRINSIQVVAH